MNVYGVNLDNYEQNIMTNSVEPKSGHVSCLVFVYKPWICILYMLKHDRVFYCAEFYVVMSLPIILVGILRRMSQRLRSNSAINESQARTFSRSISYESFLWLLKDSSTALLGKLYNSAQAKKPKVFHHTQEQFSKNSFREWKRWITIQKPKRLLMRSANREFARNFFLSQASRFIVALLRSNRIAEI